MTVAKLTQIFWKWWQGTLCKRFSLTFDQQFFDREQHGTNVDFKSISPMLKVRKVAPVGGKGWWRQRGEELTTFFLEALSIHLRLGLRLSDITPTGGNPASGQGQLEEDWTGGVQHFRQSTCGNQTSISVCMRYETREPMGRSAAVSTCSCEKRHRKRHQNDHIWTFW